ncbi:CLUMA_CG020328, isoform A [Clunio marinus]|uniref:CLUMA_CG020328, isoform A n=1 Tax=Clunio marinus TaxID=568069 RepID=A0A1J1J4L2_9DIPT|nr:CLUMA_CG020328, isoform A [Clunio marinus]
MEDSGFDSGDRVANFMQNYNSNNVESENSSSEDIVNVSNRIINVKTSNRDSIDDIVFKSSALPNLVPKFNVDNTTTGSHVSTEQQRKSHHLNEHNKKLSNINTCKGLQRKLEQKVEKAKKNFLQNEKINQMENDFETRKSSSTNLIPISRLPFPRNIESQRLVEYKSDNRQNCYSELFSVNK